MRLSPFVASIAAIGVLLIVIYGAAIGWLAWRQEAMLFQPETLAPDVALADAPDVHERRVAVPGASLSMLELRLPAPRGVVFFLHGNSGNLRSWFVNADFYRRANLDLVMLDYRGFGKSTGRIESEAQLHSDVAAAWAAVAPRYAGLPVVVYGRSLGTGLAARLATRIQPQLTMLVSPYTSMAQLVADHYPWVPGAVLRYPLRTDEVIAQIAQPVLLVHGAQDPLISPRHSQQLQALNPRAQRVTIAAAAHNDLQVHEAYLEAVRDALNSI